MKSKGKYGGPRTLGALQYRRGVEKANAMQSQRQGMRYKLREALVIAEEDTKVALDKVNKKKLEMTGTYAKRLKDGDYVEINPEKNDLVGQGNNIN